MQDGNVRLCGDYKLTISSAAKNKVYPYPESNSFPQQFPVEKLELSHTYLQLQLDESSQEYVTINTYHGLYHYTCLPLWCYFSANYISMYHGDGAQEAASGGCIS